MSFKAPRPPRASLRSSSLSRRTSTQSSEGATLHAHHHLVLQSDAPKTRRAYGSKGRVRLHNNEVLAEPLGHVFVQQPVLQTSTAPSIHPPELALDDPFVDSGDIGPSPIYISVGGDDPELRQQRRRQKKERQWTKWANETMPLLLKPYLQVLRESDNLRSLNRHSDVVLPACSCEKRASINVTCVFFERKLFYLQCV